MGRNKRKRSKIQSRKRDIPAVRKLKIRDGCVLSGETIEVVDSNAVLRPQRRNIEGIKIKTRDGRVLPTKMIKGPDSNAALSLIKRMTFEEMLKASRIATMGIRGEKNAVDYGDASADVRRFCDIVGATAVSKSTAEAQDLVNQINHRIVKVNEKRYPASVQAVKEHRKIMTEIYPGK